MTLDTDLTAEEKNIIAKGREAYKKGDFVPLEEVMRDCGVSPNKP